MLSKCGFCKGTIFEVVTKEPHGSQFKVCFVQCNGCGHPIGVIDYTNTSTEIDGLRKQIALFQSEVESKLSRLEHKLQ